MPEKNVYMDNNATTPIHPEVKKAMIDAIGVFGNPSSLHGPGRDARQLVDEAREKVASFIGASPEEVMFVGSGSEANNTILNALTCQRMGCAYHRSGLNKIVTTTIEHPCVLETSKCLKEKGVDVSYLDVDMHGKINIDQLKDIITDTTGLVSVMMANNEIGTIQDIKTIAEIVHQKGTLFHSDAVQAVGKIPVNVQELGVDFLTISGHKMYGPKGIGALYVKKGSPFCPLIRGGHQERGRRAGTENTLGIVGLGKAIEMRGQEMEAEEKRLLELKATLRTAVEESIPDVQFIGHPTDCLPGTLNVSFDGAEGEAIILYLDLEGIAVSTGSACASGSLDPSHVILATGMPAECAHGSIRISMGRENTMEEVQYVIDILPQVIRRLRDMSTVYKRRQA